MSVMNLRPGICHLLSSLRIHSPDCQHCAARLTGGAEIRRRLEELDRRRLGEERRDSGSPGRATRLRTAS